MSSLKSNTIRINLSNIMVFVSEKSIHFEREDLSDSLLYMWLFHSFSVESV